MSATCLVLRLDINTESLKGECHFEEGCSYSEQTLLGKYQILFHISVLGYSMQSSRVRWFELRLPETELRDTYPQAIKLEDASWTSEEVDSF
jgi:hypothetical protein